MKIVPKIIIFALAGGLPSSRKLGTLARLPSTRQFPCIATTCWSTGNEGLNWKGLFRASNAAAFCSRNASSKRAKRIIRPSAKAACSREGVFDNGRQFHPGLAQVAGKFQIPLEVQWSDDTETNRRLSMSWTNTDPEQIIETLVTSHRGYEFDVTDGVVHIYPRWATANGQDFVSLKLGEFIVHDQPPEIATKRLRELVKLKVSPPAPSSRGGGSMYSQAGEVGEQNISFTLRNVTVQRALDEIALASGRKIWIVTFTNGPLTPTGFRPTRTLWINKIAANEQPVWDSLRWGDRIPSDQLVR